MKTRKAIKIFTWLFATITLAIVAIFAIVFSLSAKERQKVDDTLTVMPMGVPNYSYAVNNDDSGSFDIFLTDNSGNFVRAESIDSFVCDKTFISQNGETKSVIVKNRDANGTVYYSVDSEYVIEDTVNNFDNVKLTVGITYQGKPYSIDIALRVTATPNYRLKFYYNTEAGDYKQGANSELLIGAGNKIDLAVEDANANGANIDLSTENIAQELLQHYTFDGWYIIDTNGDITSRRLYSNDYFDVSDLYATENNGMKNISVVAKYKTQLLLDDDMGEKRYLSLNNGVSTLVPNREDATDIYFNEKLPITSSELPHENSKDGWNFVDWYSKPMGEKIDYLDADGKFSLKDPHLYAKWEGDVKLDSIFETANFTFENAVIDSSDITKTTIIIPNVIYRSNLGLPTFEDIKYSHGGSFAGWYIRNGDVDVPVSGHEFVLSTNTRIYAKVNFDITLDSQGASIPQNQTTIEYGYNGNSFGVITNSLPYPQNPVENGWKFEKWNTSNDGTGDAVEMFWEVNPYEFSNPNKSSLILYAKRSTNIYLYSQLDANGENTIIPETKTIYYNRILSSDIIPTTMSDIGGWHYEGYYKVDNIVSNVVALTDTKLLSTDKYSGEGELKIGAKWTANVSLDTVFEGKITKQVEYNQLPSFPANVDYTYGNNKKGTFLGWYIGNTKIENSVAFQYSPNQEIYAKVKFPLTLNRRLMTLPDETTEEKTYYIVYGENAQNRNSVGRLESRLPSESAQKFNWTFLNWNTMDNGSGVSVVDTWEINPYKVDNLVLFDNWSIDLNIYRELDELGQPAGKTHTVITVNYGANPNIPMDLIADGWTYDGCYKTLGQQETKITNTAPYKSKDSNTDLYCQWSRDINLKITDVNTDINSEEKIKVSYNVIPKQLAEKEPEYDKGGQLAGWFTEEYGEGIEAETDKPFTLTKCDTLYNKINFSVAMDSINGLQDTVIYPGQPSYDVTYGKTLSDMGINSFLSPQCGNWDFDCWYLVIGGERYGVDKHINTPFTGANVIRDVTTDRNGNIKVLAQWNCLLTVVNIVDEESQAMITDQILAYNNFDIDISQRSWGNWNFVGWFNSLNDSGEFSEEIDNSYRGAGHTTIYGKWTCESNLIYNNNNNDRGKSKFTFGISNRDLPQSGDKFGEKDGYKWFSFWSTQDNAKYSNFDVNQKVSYDVETKYVAYPKNMANLYAIWEPNIYNVTFLDDDNNEVPNSATTVRTGERLENIVVLDKTLVKGTFIGYFYNGIRYVDENGNGIVDWDIVDQGNRIQLIAKYSYGSEKIILHKERNMDEDNSDYIIVKRDGSILLSPTINPPSWVGRVFDGYYSGQAGAGEKYYDDKGVLVSGKEKWDGSLGDLYANWTAYPIKITSVGTMNSIKDSTNITVRVDFAAGSSYSYSVSDNNSHLNISSGSGSKINGDSFTFAISRKDKDQKGTVKITVTDDNSGAQFANNYNYSTSGGCFAAGTLITMSDGSQQKIEDIKVGDMVMSWNFLTGQDEIMPVCQFYKLQDEQVDLLSLKFDDESSVNVAYSHGFFDATLNEFVFIDYSNYQEYIGHEFIKYCGQSIEKTALVSVEHTVKDMEYYALLTASNLNVFAENFMTLTKPYIEGTHTYFEVGENLMYDEEKMQADIDRYGLYSYEEARAIVREMGFEDFPYEYYVAVNVQYYKILIGKGIVTFDDIAWLISDLVKHG